MVMVWISYNVSRNYVVIKGSHVIVYERIKSYSFKNYIMHELYMEEKLRKLRGKRTLEILINSQRGKFSSEFCGKWGIRVECTVCPLFQ